MNTDFGLEVSSITWLLYGSLVVFWYLTLRLVPGQNRLGWQAIPMSLFGWAWLGFGLHFIIRFPFLCWDSFVFGNMTPRLADATSEQVDETLLLAILFFVCLAVAYRAGRGLMAGRIVRVGELVGENSHRAQLLLACLASIGVVLSSGYIPMPKALITPFGILGSFWVFPAVYAWWDWFRGGERRISALCWILLLPGLLRVILSPYRENLFMVLLAVFFAALFAGKRLRPVSIILTLIAFFLISTVVIGAYRQFLWEGETVKEALEYSQSGYTLEKTPDAKWVEALRRFHGFDSLLLTVRYVPEFLPHSERNVVVDAFVRGIVPRAIDEDKERGTRGVDFGQSIWSYESELSDSGATIAPSMPGDLYDAGDVTMVALGGIIWGFILGLLEGWRARLSPKAMAAFITLFAIQCVASMERDFAFVVSTAIQYLIVMFLLTKFLGRSDSRALTERVPGRT